MELQMCAMSDLHGQLPQIRREVDILCICGDIVPCEIQHNFDKSLEWLQTTFYNWIIESPVKNVVMIWGNHDFIGQHLMDNGSRVCEIAPDGYFDGDYQHSILFQNDTTQKIHILCHEFATIEGINFFGTPWCPNLRNWAFYGERDTLKEKFNQIPVNTQILITHCPPKYGLQGTVLETNWNYMSDFGCVQLQEVIDDKFLDKDMWVLSGHIHSGKHEVEKLNDIKYRQVSLLDENYEVSYQPFTFNF
jgi:Icc-related predicted phosphoesterase